MKIKRILGLILATAALMTSLAGCGKVGVEVDMSEEKTEADQKDLALTEVKLIPIMDKETNTPSKVIPLTDFDLILPDGYIFGKIEQVGYTMYCVWPETVEGDQYFLSSDIMLYVSEGVDANSPHKELTEKQIRTCICDRYMNYFLSAAALSQTSTGSYTLPTDDGKSNIVPFTGKGGEALFTTYGAGCYPKTYYGIYVMDIESVDASRSWAGFVFSNDGNGEIFKQSEYENLVSQIKKAYRISSVYRSSEDTPAELDISNGWSYHQLACEVLYEDKTGETTYGLFYNTLLYYVMRDGRGYERTNVDAPGTVPTTEPTGELAND